MTWLEYSDALQEVPSDSEVIVGTGAQATWRLRRADLMPRHFIVTSSPDGAAAQIRPFCSDAVVSLNGHQVSCEPTSLADGDVISAGSGQFRFWAATPGENRPVLAAPPPAIAHLVDGGRRSALFLNRISSGIGRDESNALVINEASTFEAEIRREAGGHAIRVSSPSNVRVNGRPVSAPILLSEGDEIQIGNRVLHYTRESVVEEPSAAEVVRVSEALELTPSEVDDDAAYAHLATHRATVALRNPMRAVAFVSSVIAAVAIATLVFLHRGP